MGPGQREAGLRVIELAIRPLDSVVAELASGREAGVRWIVGIVVIGLVARNAQVAGQVVVVVDVAVGARPGRNGVRTGQREAPPAEEFALVDPELLPFPWQEAKRSKAASETTKETFFFFMVFPFIQAAFPENVERLLQWQESVIANKTDPILDASGSTVPPHIELDKFLGHLERKHGNLFTDLIRTQAGLQLRREGSAQPIMPLEYLIQVLGEMFHK